jgi:hypothetical protein
LGFRKWREFIEWLRNYYLSKKTLPLEGYCALQSGRERLRTLKMEAASSSEFLLHLYQSTHRHLWEDSDFTVFLRYCFLLCSFISKLISVHKALANELNDDRNHRLFLRSIGNIIHLESFSFCNYCYCRSHWPHSLRRGSVATRLLGLWVRIPPGAWMFVSCECCVLSGRGLCVRLFNRPEKSYRVCCVWMWSWILDNEEAWPTRSCCAMKKKYCCYTMCRPLPPISFCTLPCCKMCKSKLGHGTVSAHSRHQNC